MTTVEILMVLAILAVLAGLAFHFAPTSTGFARTYAAGIVGARLRSATTGGYVAVGRGSCDLATDRVVPDPAPAKVVAFPVRGLLFTPDGLPRTCDGGGVGNTTILLEHRGRQAAVIVSSLGRVRWEPR